MAQEPKTYLFADAGKDSVAADIKTQPDGSSTGLANRMASGPDMDAIKTQAAHAMAIATEISTCTFSGNMKIENRSVPVFVTTMATGDNSQVRARFNIDQAALLAEGDKQKNLARVACDKQLPIPTS